MSATTLALVMGCEGPGRSGSVDYFGEPPPAASGGSSNTSAGSGDGGEPGSDTGGDPTAPSTTPPQGGSAAAGGASTTNSGSPPTGAPGPRFIGRFTGEGEFAWSGSAIELRFMGSEVAVTLDDWGNNFFEVIIDGGHQVLAAAAGPQSYLLASGLSPGEHELLLYRRTEAYLGPSQFLGFSVPDSHWLPARAPADRRIEIVADSTATGYGIEGANQNCSFEAETENSYIAYGDVTGRALGAEVRTLGWSGIGVYRDNSGNPGNNMRLRYGRTVPTDEQSTWDFSQWIPQAVVVNLGSNDFVKDDPGQLFDSAYQGLLDEIRSYYPEARLYCAVGSSVVDSEYPLLKARLEAIVAARAATGESIALLDFGTTDQDASYACDWHPSAGTHQAMANVLIQALQQDLGW